MNRELYATSFLFFKTQIFPFLYFDIKHAEFQTIKIVKSEWSAGLIVDSGSAVRTFGLRNEKSWTIRDVNSLLIKSAIIVTDLLYKKDLRYICRIVVNNHIFYKN